jgi:hypothetical protein
MISHEVTIPTIGLIAGTRMALGVGIGLLMADRLTAEQRRAAGLALVAVGAVSTIPLIATVLGAQAHGNGRAFEDQRGPIGGYPPSTLEGVIP